MSQFFDPLFGKRGKKKDVKGPSLCILLGLMVLFLSGCGLINPQTGGVEGWVFRETSMGTSPVQDALVSISGSSNTAYTDDNGYFFINEISTGKRSLSVVKEGYVTTQLLNVIIEPDIINEVNFGNPIILKPKEDQAVFDLAYEYYLLGEYQLALDTFQDLQTNFPDSLVLDAAQYYKAWCYIGLEEYTEAINVFEYLLVYFPQSNLRDDAQYDIGWCYEKKLGLHIQATLAYYAVLFEYPNSPWADDAQLGLGNCYYATLDFGNAIIEYQKVIDNYPFSDLLPLAQYSIAQSYRRAYYRLTAIEKYQELILLYPESEYCAPSQYYIGYTYYERDDFQLAIDEFQKVIDLYPNSTWPEEERQIAPSAQYYIGWCSEKLERWNEALEAYQLVVDHYPGSTWSDGSSIPSFAQDRIDWIMENYPPEEG